MLEILIFLTLLALGYGVGKQLEHKHFLSIVQRERDLAHIATFSSKRPPDTFCDQFLVQGSVVVSSDYFKQFMSAWRLFFGGRLQSYETLLERARREAVLRMKQEADYGHANVIFNVKLETSVISEQSGNNGAIGTVEILAYGTAGRL
ncbi:MAG: heavy metal-binding domain-containing protein [Neisseriaceae bacterium]|nr:heavy metal-binding domain-containing protein [Neisseriaceae bacterium]